MREKGELKGEITIYIFAGKMRRDKKAFEAFFEKPKLTASNAFCLIPYLSSQNIDCILS